MTTQDNYKPIQHRQLNLYQKRKALEFDKSYGNGWNIKPYDHFTNVDESTDLYQVVDIELANDTVVYRECNKGRDGPLHRAKLEVFTATNRVLVPSFVLDPR